MDSELPGRGSLGSRARPARVLIVDDNEDLRRIVRFALGRLNQPLEIAEASDGESALAHMRTSPPDLVVLDLMMPGIDGIEVCRRIRGELGLDGTLVLVLTAREDSRSRAQATEAGADGFLLKPIERAELMRQVEGLLARGRGSS